MFSIKIKKMCNGPSKYCSVCFVETEEKAGEDYYKDLGWLNCHWSCWDNLQLRFESYIQLECNLDLETFDRYKGFLLFMGA